MFRMRVDCNLLILEGWDAIIPVIYRGEQESEVEFNRLVDLAWRRVVATARSKKLTVVIPVGNGPIGLVYTHCRMKRPVGVQVAAASGGDFYIMWDGKNAATHKMASYGTYYR